MNRTEFEAGVCELVPYNRDVVEGIVEAALGVIVEQLAAGNSINLTGLFKLGVKHCAARNGKNPKTGEAIYVAARNKLVVKAGKKLNALINNGVE